MGCNAKMVCGCGGKFVNIDDDNNSEEARLICGNCGRLKTVRRSSLPESRNIGTRNISRKKDIAKNNKIDKIYTKNKDLRLFEKHMRAACKKIFEKLRKGTKKKEILKRRKKKNSLTSMIKERNYPGEVSKDDLTSSCVKAFGHVFQNAAKNFAKEKGMKVIASNRSCGTELDLILDKPGEFILALESKANIDVDTGKSKEVKRRLQTAYKILSESREEKMGKTSVIPKYIKDYFNLPEEERGSKAEEYKEGERVKAMLYKVWQEGTVLRKHGDGYFVLLDGQTHDIWRSLSQMQKLKGEEKVAESGRM